MIKSIPRFLTLSGFFLVIFGGKLWFLGTAGSDLPTWDQWDAEGTQTLQPWIEGTFGWGDLLRPHNEHRIITTKLWALGLFQLNGQWDAALEAAANALVHTGCALALLLLAARWLPGRWLVTFGFLLVALFTLPFSWENTLFGFQVSFYFLLLFSIGHIVLTLESDLLTWRWAFGQISGVLALATLASGFFSSLAVLSVLTLRLVRERTFSRQQFASGLLALCLVLVGGLSRTEVPGHASMRAHGLDQFLQQFLQLVAWPGSFLFPWALLLAWPGVTFFWQRLRDRQPTPEDSVFLGMISWILLQSAAIAYARGGGESVLSPRYFDLLSIHVALGFVFLVRQTAGRTRFLVAALWLVGIGSGLTHQSCQRWRDSVVPKIARQQLQAANVRGFLATADPAFLLNQAWDNIPYPDGHVLLRHLSVPALQHSMPPSVRRPVDLGDDGVSKALPPSFAPAPAAIAASTWQGAAPGGEFRWRSQALPAEARPILRFRVAGDLGVDHSRLRLVVKSAAGESVVTPDAAPGARWKTVNVFRPAGEWWIEVRDDDPDAWFAFTRPVEVGRLTWLAAKLTKHHFTVLFVGVGLLAVGGVLPLMARGNRFA